MNGRQSHINSSIHLQFINNEWTIECLAVTAPRPWLQDAVMWRIWRQDPNIIIIININIIIISISQFRNDSCDRFPALLLW